MIIESKKKLKKREFSLPPDIASLNNIIALFGKIASIYILKEEVIEWKQ